MAAITAAAVVGAGIALYVYVLAWQGGGCDQNRYPAVRRTVDHYLSDVAAEVRPVSRQQARYNCQESQVRGFAKLAIPPDQAATIGAALSASGWRPVDGSVREFTRDVGGRRARAVVVPEDSDVHLTVYVELDD